MSKYKTSNHFYRVLVFWVGIIATFSYRVIVVLNYYSQPWVEIAWYVGTLGFIWYFAHRFRVENKREKVIEELNLSHKISDGQELNAEDREALLYILGGLKSSMARWNYIVIFIFSVLALIYGIVNDIIRFLN